jgi:hypothetical protein
VVCRNAAHLEKHQKLHQPGAKTHRCECGNVFGDRTGITQCRNSRSHKERQYEKPLANALCGIDGCTVRCRNAEHLKEHQKLHQPGAIVYVCTCGRFFPHRGTRNSCHRRHDKSNENQEHEESDE